MGNAPRPRAARGLAVTAVALLATVAVGCSSSSTNSTGAAPSGGKDGGTVPTNVSTTTTTRPARVPKASPAALEGPITVGTLSGPASPVSIDLGTAGYVTEEFFAGGTATAYASDGEQTADGRWTVKPDTTAPYKTRIIVRRPTDPAKFNGTVAVEWFNVSGGVEADPDFAYIGNELVRQGYAYVGVSAQALGINGGKGIIQATDSVGGGLRAAQPERYGSLVHPGDQYALDMYAQVGAAVRSPGAVKVLGGLQPKRILAVGESQSALYMTTFANAIQPISNVYDGFFIHSRGGSGAPLGSASVTSGKGVAGARIRTDLDAPVFIFETESDVGGLLNYSPARQPDTDTIRVWEVAGTAHADAHLVGSFASALGCVGRVNEGPQHFVAKAAINALNTWVAHGTPPPKGEQITLASTDPATVARDAHGNALGGIRTPMVEVPVAALSGEPTPGSSVLCSLFGSTTPFDAATITQLYPSKDRYVADFEASLDKTIEAGFVLPADRAEFLALAQDAEWPS